MAYPLAVTLLFFISPLLSLVFVIHGLFTSKKYSLWFGAIFATTIGLLVYSIIPNQETDLYRYYQYLDNISRYSFSDVISSIWSAGDPLSYSLMYIVSHFLSNNFVPFVVALIDYSILFYIVFDYRKRFIHKQDWRTCLCILFIISTFIVFNSLIGLRFSVGALVFLLALYLDTVREEKWISKILYISSIFFHSSMLLMVVLRVGAWLFSRRSIIFYTLAIATGSVSSLLMIFSEQLSAIPFLSHFGRRAADYLVFNIPSGFVYPFNLLTCVLLLVVIFLMRQKKRSSSIIVKLNIATILIAFANFYQFVIASRFTTISKYLFILVLLEFLVDSKNEKLTRNNLIAITLLGIVILGNLCFQFIAFSGVELMWTFPEVLYKNMIQLLVVK